jgi:undecaprenyl-diphosphatase
MNLITLFLADYLIFAIFLIVFFLWVYKSEHKLILVGVSSSVIAWIISLLIKTFFYLPRPFIITSTQPLIGFLMDGTFPSSHSSLAFALSSSVFIKKPRLGMVLFFLSVLMVSARVFGGVHTVTDVIAGAVIGVLTTITLNARLLKHGFFID